MLFSVFLLILAIITQFSTNARGEVIHMGISTPGLYEIPTEIALRKGFYKEENLDVRKVVMRTNLQVPALMAGELDYSTVSGLIARASIQNLPVKGVMGWFDRPLHILVARPGFKRLTDFKNKKIGVSGLGSAPHIILREALSQAGMNPDRDVTTITVGGSGDRLAALVAGTVDGTPLDVAYVERAEKLGLVSVLYFGDIVHTRLGGFGVSMDKIRKNPTQIVRVIRASLKGVRFIRDNKPETLTIMRDYLKVSPEGAVKVYDFSMRSLNFDGLVAKNTMDSKLGWPGAAEDHRRISEDNHGCVFKEVLGRCSLNDNALAGRSGQFLEYSRKGRRLNFERREKFLKFAP
jgi:ABC-type nitrate/sulfonate/bicarbonate transport system substrate-binding protein